MTAYRGSFVGAIDVEDLITEESIGEYVHLLSQCNEVMDALATLANSVHRQPWTHRIVAATVVSLAELFDDHGLIAWRGRLGNYRFAEHGQMLIMLDHSERPLAAHKTPSLYYVLGRGGWEDGRTPDLQTFLDGIASIYDHQLVVLDQLLEQGRPL